MDTTQIANNDVIVETMTNISESATVIELVNVSRSFPEHFGIFGRKVALDNISLIVKAGEFLVLRGDNDAGKSTLVKIVLGLLKPSNINSQVLLFGRSPEDPASRIHVGTVLQKARVPGNFSVSELINLVRSYYPEPMELEDILERVGLQKRKNDQACNLNGGAEQKLYFALALAGNPRLLILDEPTNHLSSESRQIFWEQVREFSNQGKTILLITHNDSDFEQIKDLPKRFVKLDRETHQIISDEIVAGNPNVVENTSSDMGDSNNSTVLNPIHIFWRQVEAEILQLIRTPIYIGGILLLSCLVTFFPPEEHLDGLIVLLFFAGINILTVATERTGKRVAVERSEGWLKLIRITPLPTWVYLSAKMLVSTLVCGLSLVVLLRLGAWKFEIYQDNWLGLYLSLLVGAVPFAIFGLALGYLVKPKSVDSITGLLLPAAMFSSGLPMPNAPDYVQNLVIFSPFYHYSQLVLWSAGLEKYYDGHLDLHIQWLIWTACFFALVASWAYQNDQVSKES